MNINININDTSDATSNTAEDPTETTSAVADAGLPPSDVAGTSADDQNSGDTDAIASMEDGHVDIGGPPEWLLQAMSESTSEEDDATAATDEDMDDGGSGPELD
ncbi:hypothetical protein [Zobellia uliginosa]|uniref:hypothetical protein n=1 Tax=Zobellia uliginosa TaxID=143224 RepID=UPI001C071601|nr:hypothetical protein [Zobellia uliginosa]MBU2947394.1 hypothetical protein [Zobellia uliginosa]